MRIHDSSPNPQRKQTQALPPDTPLRDRVVHAIKQVYDPEIPVDIFELGLVYDIQVDNSGKKVTVKMTLTTPHCPEAQSIPQYVKQSIERLDDVDEADVQIVWEPPWTKDRMSDAARLQLGMM